MGQVGIYHRFEQIWLRLTNPSSAIQDPCQRRQARLLSSILLALLIASVTFDLIPYWINHTGSDRSFHILVLSVETLAFLYVLSRSRHYPLVAALTMVSTSATVFALALLSDKSYSLAYLVIPVLLSGIFLTTQAALLLIVLQLIMMVGAQVAFDIPFESREIELVVVASVLIVLESRYWTLMEQDRQRLLATERNLLRAVIDHIPDLVGVKDTKGQYILQNAATLNFFRKTMLGKTDFELYPPETAEEHQAHEQDVIQSGQALVNHEETWITPDGQTHWLLTTITPMRDSQGTIVGVVDIGRDITEHQRAKETLTRYNQRLKLLHLIDQTAITSQSSKDIAQIMVENLKTILPCNCASILLADRHNDTVQVLADWSELDLPWDFSIEKWTTAKTRQQLIPDLAQVVAPIPLYRALLGQGIHTYLSIPLMTDGDLWGELNIGASAINAFSSEHLEIVQEASSQLAVALRYVALHQRLQQHTVELEQRVKQRTAELERATRRVEAILNNTSDAILLAYSDGTITHTNPAFDSMFHYKPDTLFHQPLTAIVDPAYSGLLEQTLQDVVNQGDAKQIEIEACHADKTAFAAEVGLALVTGNEFHRSSIVCSVRDITTRKRVEEELRLALQHERDLNDMKSRFIWTVSHEFRTPLATISSSADLLRQYFDRMEQAQRDNHFEAMHSAIQSIVDILDNTLFWSGAKSGQMVIKRGPVHLSAFCQEVVGQFQRKLPSQIHLNCSYAGPAGEVSLDQRLLRIILTNVISNAIKYSPNGGTIQLDIQGDEDAIMLCISDQGIGIPPEDLARIGESFYRAHNVGTIRGTGVGLSITRQAVDLHEGTMTIESEVQIGTTITIKLPCSV
jgi:PAS domain S-box-containing protein